MEDRSPRVILPGVIVQGAVQTTIFKQVTDMTPDASRTYVECADKQYAVPARQESVRVATVTVGILALAFIGHVLHISDTLLGCAIISVGGIYGVPKAIEKYRSSPPGKALPPAE